MFVDTAKVTVEAGKGGDGVVSFRHEIYVDKGGPDGGDGGRGGDVIFIASDNVNTLADFRYKPELKAKSGQNGSKQKKRGRSGEDLIVKVPVGTIVRRNGEVVADFVENGQEVVIAKGGDGGFGNAHFKSSVRQTPRIAELGEPGDAFEAELEMKLLGDVGLVGFPNAGKSTFLSVVSNARPEIANYAFTTLTPNLGVADFDDTSLLIADIPGLIEGASEGKGLGDAFLKHVERTAVLLHLIDVYEDDIAARYRAIRHELEMYSPVLIDRPEVIALTKCEGLDEEIIQMQKETVEAIAHAPVYPISAHTHQGVKDLLRVLRVKVDAAREKELIEQSNVAEDTSMPVITLSNEHLENAWTVGKESIVTESGEQETVFTVTGAKIEKFARRTNTDSHENTNRLRDIMRKMGIMHELYRQGATGESTVIIGDTELTLVEQQE